MTDEELQAFRRLASAEAQAMVRKKRRLRCENVCSEATPMARRLPRWVVYSSSTKEVYDMPDKASAKAYCLPEYGDRYGKVTWEKPAKKKVRR